MEKRVSQNLEEDLSQLYNSVESCSLTAPSMANDNPEELLATEAPETDQHIYDPVACPDKVEQNQRLAVEELINTEISYVHNLQLCISDIYKHLQNKQLPELNLEELFSNIDDVLQVSKHFLQGLEATVNQEHDQLFHISTLFQDFKEEMENVYKVYCANYDQALLLLEIYRKNPRLQKEIVDTLVSTVPHTSASDLSFFLVMPVQRITKYPLLLQKILENTPDNDGAYKALQAAASAMLDVSVNINEYKRQKEVANKYNKPGYLTLRDRLARLNPHSIAKKTTRLSRLFMHEAGIVSKTEDKEFDELEEKFQQLATAVTDLKENVATFLSNTEAFLSSKPHENQLEIGAETTQLYCQIAGKLHSAVFLDLRKRMEDLVYHPLCNLTEVLKGPQKLIKKRLDKLLDYEELEEKQNETGNVTYEEEAAMNTYLAINSLLVSELPVLNNVALQWLRHILASFVAIQRDLAKQVLQETEGAVAQLPHRHLPAADYWKMVKETLSQAEGQLSSLRKKIETVEPSPVVQPLNVAEERKVLLLMNKHGPDKLYQITANTSGSKDMDLTLQRGQIVALLHDKDTKGNPNRWLVDTGGPRGYVSPGKLQRYHVVPNQKPRSEVRTESDGAKKLHHSYNVPPLMNPPVNFNTPALHVIAAYAFTARNSHEVTLQAGQPVNVLEPHDKKGNKEWSLVEVNGQKGYVPSSFLVAVPTAPNPVWPFPTQQT
ncbi:rho guanine nucleotide exchange factor 37 isoform X1 [Anolis carolinensis]|uniref:rho guanine nucleotide exchange factor 37 isoform X1 n=2 Tax=Anolis carolinensis TaxID=28377 RepID=UPI0002C896CA|nr:PREDICTED: rho guanine nucleotide exchange factor 37 isoform X1 [Anolis carolinensis]XP_016846914.1 PREDICTED: rho guanine nucleotide exchange factor 37 isoform X1 [Anolis carolinensis]|eukprot:XP_008102865.1 PREDICTED: rho guanine nucleotide exchange factor 37 isoform X1 [Anolis carolinensis]